MNKKDVRLFKRISNFDNFKVLNASPFIVLNKQYYDAFIPVRENTPSLW
jgi:hypothetical protein